MKRKTAATEPQFIALDTLDNYKDKILANIFHCPFCEKPVPSRPKRYFHIIQHHLKLNFCPCYNEVKIQQIGLLQQHLLHLTHYNFASNIQSTVLHMMFEEIK
jgi:hypothetical protein